MSRQGLMDDSGYHGLDECANYESCTNNFVAELLEPYDAESIEDLINNVRSKAIDEFAEKLSGWCCDEGIAETPKVIEMIFYLAERLKEQNNEASNMSNNS